MTAEERKKKSVFWKILEDKQAIRECLQSGDDLEKLAKERGLKFATPI